MARQKKNVKEKVQSEYPEFAETVDSLSIADLEKRLSAITKENEKVLEALENDVELNNAKELVSELSGPYRDIKKAIRLKTSYLIASIREKGGEA